MDRNLLSLDHSFGYDCKRLYNLALINGETILHGTGRYLHFYDVNSGELSYWKPENDKGIGHIATHPTKAQFAVGEKGDNPLIIVYQWPSLETVQTLRGGAEKGYTHLTFSPDGELLASVSCRPDYRLVIWRWDNGEILLSAKAYHHEVYQIVFSLFNADQLASCGVNHLKLWKMGETFTGLKLLGRLCRFGKTDSCNLIGAVPLPDGSCATGSAWGNILIWTEGSIYLEVCRVGRLPCHSAAVTQLHFHNNTLMTAGLDGVARLWNYELIESADPSEEELSFEMEPLIEFPIRDGKSSAEIMCLVKAQPQLDDTLWFAQGNRGAVWIFDVSIKVGTKPPPRKVFWAHAGPVIALQTSPAGPFFATLGNDSKIIVFNYSTKKIEAFLEFPAPGTCLIWPDLSIDSSGSILVTAFSNGVLRVLAFSSQNLSVVQAVKPHTTSIVSMEIANGLIVTASSDSTIFLFRIGDYFQLSPIGFVELENLPHSVCHIGNFSFIVGSINGVILKFNFENVETLVKNGTYCLKVSSEIVRKNDCDETQKPIALLTTLPNHSVWFAINNENSSILYEYDSKNGNIVKMRDISCQISCAYYCPGEDCLYLGLVDGIISVLKCENGGKLTENVWNYGIHDSDRGAIRQIATSWDYGRLFSCGNDGGVFSFVLNGVDNLTREPPQTISYQTLNFPSGVADPSSLSLEEAQVQENSDNRRRFADEAKGKVRAEISRLRSEFENILGKIKIFNEDLPEEVQIPYDAFVADQRVVDDFIESLAEEKNLVYRKLARDSERSEKLLGQLRKYFLDNVEALVTRVDGIRMECHVKTIRIRKIGEDFHRDLEAVQKIVEDMDKRGSVEDIPTAPDVIPVARAESPDPVDALVKQVATLGDVSRNRKLTLLIRQHKARRAATAARSVVWENHMRRKPDPDRSDPKDLIAVEIAKETFGDYKLKTSKDYKVAKHRIVTTVSKYKALLEARLRIFEMHNDFNKKVFELRKRKRELRDKHLNERRILSEILREIPPDLAKSPPELIEINIRDEYPEDRFQLADINHALPERFRKLVVVEDPVEKKFDMEYEILFGESKKPCASGTIPKMLAAVGDSRESPWETEMREMRILRKCNEQNKIIGEMFEEIADFDRDVMKLSEEKISLEADTKYLHLYLMMLHREILVLKAFEKEEEERSTISFGLLISQRDLQIAMNDVTARMEEKIAEIQEHETQVKRLTTDFLDSIAENKFYEYLKRIFKKRYKPPKKEDNDDSSSDSSSDSDEQDDEKSLDSREVNYLKLSENVCPDGCDVNDYERTFRSRGERHNLELKITDKRKWVVGLKKEFDALTKQKLKIEFDYAKAQNDFDNLQRDKQAKLNEIETVAVLRLSQLQNFNDSGQMEIMDDSLIISEALMTQLYNRVGELLRETTQQMEKRAMNKQHFTRMTLDIRHMTEVSTDLEKQIQASMFQKFGTKVDLDELEQSLVKKLVAEMGFIPMEVQEKLEMKLRTLQGKSKDRIDAYAARMLENTKRYNILAILKDESNKLDDALVKQEVRKSLPPRHRAFETADLDKLADSVKKQESEVARLKEEILCLKSKNRPHSSGQFPLREMNQMALIRGPDGEYQEISLTVRNRLSNLLPNAQAIINADQDSDSQKKLKKIVEDFMESVPERALKSIWEELTQGRCLENLDDMLENRDVLFKAADLMVQMIATIIPSVFEN